MTDKNLLLVDLRQQEENFCWESIANQNIEITSKEKTTSIQPKNSSFVYILQSFRHSVAQGLKSYRLIQRTTWMACNWPLKECLTFPRKMLKFIEKGN